MQSGVKQIKCGTGKKLKSEAGKAGACGKMKRRLVAGFCVAVCGVLFFSKGHFRRGNFERALAGCRAWIGRLKGSAEDYSIIKV